MSKYCNAELFRKVVAGLNAVECVCTVEQLCHQWKSYFYAKKQNDKPLLFQHFDVINDMLTGVCAAPCKQEY